jgi:hypothetical protein
LLLTVLALLYNKWAPRLLIALVFLAYIALANIVAPLEGPLGHFSEQAIHAASGKTVYVPSNFRSQYERYRFLLPGAEIRSYAYEDDAARKRLLDAGELVIADLAPHTDKLDHYEVIGQRLTIRSRMPQEDIAPVLKERRMELLFRQELLLQGVKL